MFDKLREVNYFKEITNSKSLVMWNILKRIKRLKSKNRDVFRTQESIYDGAFCEYT